MVFVVFQKALAELATDLNCVLIPEVVCECVDKKRDLLYATFPNTRHVYKDVHDLADGNALDEVCGDVVDPCPDILFI